MDIIDEKLNELVEAGADPVDIAARAKRLQVEVRKRPFLQLLRDPETNQPAITVTVNDRQRLIDFFAAPIPEDNHPQKFYRELSEAIGYAINTGADDQSIIDNLLIGALAFK